MIMTARRSDPALDADRGGLERVNPSSGAIGIGHPFEASGTRYMLALATELPLRATSLRGGRGLRGDRARRRGRPGQPGRRVGQSGVTMVESRVSDESLRGC
jgi:acetyl-CoA acetyltransferase